MSNRVVTVRPEHEVFIAKIRVTHVPQDRKMQVDVASLRLTMQQQHAVAATLSARSDIRSARISVGGWLNIEYKHDQLTGQALDNFVDKIDKVVKQLIARKMAENATA